MVVGIRIHPKSRPPSTKQMLENLRVRRAGEIERATKRARILESEQLQSARQSIVNVIALAISASQAVSAKADTVTVGESVAPQTSSTTERPRRARQNSPVRPAQ